MYALTIKIVRLLFLGFLPLLVISSVGNHPELSPNLPNGTYVLELTGNTNYALDGTIGFSQLTETSVAGETFSVLRLFFSGQGDIGQHDMEVVVSKENETGSMPLGNYEVKNVDSFLSPFNGIFGAFSSDRFGEKPFFTNKGSVQITQCHKNLVKGALNLILENQAGEILVVKGNFDASSDTSTPK